MPKKDSTTSVDHYRYSTTKERDPSSRDLPLTPDKPIIPHYVVLVKFTISIRNPKRSKVTRKEVV